MPRSPEVVASASGPAAETVLTDEMLARFAKRAPQYDRDNAFFTDDFEELRQAGYLALAVPAELGGAGLSLAGVASSSGGSATTPRRRRSRSTCTSTGPATPPTSGAPATRRSAGCSRRAAAGEVFAAGHAESGNDIPVLLSTTKAERVEGGYRFTGRKSFGSLSPVWTYLGIHGMDTADPSQPKIVHAFMPRDTEGYRIEPDLGRAGHARDAQRRHDPRRRVRPRSLRRAGRARRRRRHRRISCSGSSPGR